MNKYINFYNQNNEIIDEKNPITATVDIEGEEIKQNITIKCENGYKTTGKTVIKATGDTVTMWAFEYREQKKDYGEPIEIDDVITESEPITLTIYTRAHIEEQEQNDASVILELNTTITKEIIEEV